MSLRRLLLIVMMGFLGFLACISLHAVQAKGEANSLLNSARMFYVVMQTMAVEEGAKRGVEEFWPGDWRDAEMAAGRPADHTTYLKLLMQEQQLDAGDLEKLTACKFVQDWDWQPNTLNARHHSSFKMYAAHWQDPAVTLLLATRNYILGSTARREFAPEVSRGLQGRCVVVLKNGQGLILTPDQVKSFPAQLPGRTSAGERPEDYLLE